MDMKAIAEAGRVLEELMNQKKNHGQVSFPPDKGTNVPVPPVKNSVAASPASDLRTADVINKDKPMDFKGIAEAGKVLQELMSQKKSPGQVSLPPDKGTNIIAPTSKNSTAVIPVSGIRTADVVASLIKQKRNKHIKQSSIETYEKKLEPFSKVFPILPENAEPVIDYLDRFGGETGRHRRNNQDLIKMLYTHAVKSFGLRQNPMDKLERIMITHKPIRTLSFKQGQILIKVTETLPEKAALELLYGHGWRQVEVLRITARDVAEISDDTILCHGKEREEFAPLLPQTQELLKKMAKGRKPVDHIFISQDGKKQPLGADGMAQLIARLFKRAGIRGFTGHDLRRSFATHVATASKNELLAMRLIRDIVPGVGARYINFPMEELVDGVKKYSPVSQTGETGISLDPSGSNFDGGDGGELNSTTLKSPILLVFSLLDQLTALGETAKRLKTVLIDPNPQRKELLSNVLKIEENSKDK